MEGQGWTKFKVWVPVLFALVLILGMVLGFNLRDTLRAKRDIETVLNRNDRLEEIIDLVNEKYVDSVNPNTLYKDAVNGILKHLDPHTVYIPPEDVQTANEGLEGGFFGIGLEFSIVRDTIEVTSVVENGPAEHAGVQVGDQLIKVGDTLVAGARITPDRIVHLLKGKQYSLVYVTLRQPNSGKEKQVPITRDVIPVYSVESSIMLDSNTGFIKINRFGAKTYDEFVKALKKLKTLGATQLMLDLRGNPGGYLEAATSVLDEFINDNKLLVFTKGFHSPKTEYRANEDGLFESGRLAVLVDESSASASEIVAGAIQDWDRGVIIGRRTFGKGLVQEEYDMDNGAALRLTIARYYTPSGRCIQRSFAAGKDAYEEDFEKRFEDGELTGYDTVLNSDTTKYYTAKHRVVYGGGGITPDIYVPYDTARYSRELLIIVFSEQLKAVLWDYFIHNRENLHYKDLGDFDKNFKGQETIYKTYVSLLKMPERGMAEYVLSKPANRDYFNLQVKAQVARFLFKENGYYAFINRDDNVVQKALQVLNSNKYLNTIER